MGPLFVTTKCATHISRPLFIKKEHGNIFKIIKLNKLYRLLLLSSIFLKLSFNLILSKKIVIFIFSVPLIKKKMMLVKYKERVVTIIIIVKKLPLSFILFYFVSVKLK